MFPFSTILIKSTLLYKVHKPMRNNCYQKEVYQLNKFISSSGTATTKGVKELVQPLLMMGGKVGVENEVEDEDEDGSSLEQWKFFLKIN